MPDMLYQDKVAWLWRYRDGLKKQRILQQHIQELRALAERITPTISPTPGGGGDGNAMARAVENMAKAQQDLADQVEHCNQIRAEVSGAIDKVDKSRDREILARRNSSRSPSTCCWSIAGCAAAIIGRSEISKFDPLRPH